MRPLVLLWGCLVLPGYGVLVGPKEISGFEGDTLSLQCTYGEELKKHKKYWCREGGLLISRCSGTIYAEEDGQERTAGRVSVWDSPEELTLTVTLRNLTLQDAGKYWCGVSRLGFDWSFLVSLRVLPGTSRPATQLDSTSAETSLVPSSRSSKSRVSIPMVRILAPVLVLLSLLLTAGLAALSRYLLRRRKEAQLAAETQRMEKVHLPHSTSEEAEASSRDPEGATIPGPPLHLSEEELDFSKFISV
ncbi:CMRF35-like molecule 9 isoform X14 [Equus przewalskii]|uniref:CMRF35-like molecule 9 isoform X14 n=1 Tax=Equus przewalskii TaxID=9798 RepID=A0ABM4JKL5_EQUPR